MGWKGRLILTLNNNKLRARAEGENERDENRQEINCIRTQIDAQHGTTLVNRW